MKRLRTLLFWGHLAIGVTAGVVIGVMSATGAALALKLQMLRLVDRDVRSVTPRDTPRLPPSRWLAAVRDARGDLVVQSVALDRDPSAAAAVGDGRTTVYVDPYDGRVLGEASALAQRVFRTLEDWHRWLGASGDARAAARSITGAANLGFFALALSGLYLWWPRQWSVRHTRPILTFRRSLTGRARDFNWHNVIGFWCAPIIIVLTLTAAVLSYPWANDLLFRLTGSVPPSAARRAAPAAADRSAPGRGGAAGGFTPADVDRAWNLAEAKLPSWRSIVMRIPGEAAAPFAFTLGDGRSWNAFARSQLAVDPQTGAVVRWQPYEANSAGQKARVWVRFGHTGEIAGVVGQVAAGIASAGGAVLMWTGIALAVRRLAGWLPGIAVARTRGNRLLISADDLGRGGRRADYSVPPGRSPRPTSREGHEQMEKRSW